MTYNSNLLPDILSDIYQDCMFSREMDCWPPYFNISAPHDTIVWCVIPVPATFACSVGRMIDTMADKLIKSSKNKHNNHMGMAHPLTDINIGLLHIEGYPTSYFWISGHIQDIFTKLLIFSMIWEVSIFQIPVFICQPGDPKYFPIFGEFDGLYIINAFHMLEGPVGKISSKPRLLITLK